MAVTVSTLAMLRSSAKLAWNTARTKSPHQRSAAAVQATRAARRLGRGKPLGPRKGSPSFAHRRATSRHRHRPVARWTLTGEQLQPWLLEAGPTAEGSHVTAAP